MNENNIKEIDVVDLLIDWLNHWRSLIVFLLIGLVVAGSYIYLGHGKVSEISVKQKMSVEEMESELLSEKDIIYVNELVDLYNNYLENVAEYERQKESLELKDRTEAFEYITDTKNILEARKSVLTEEQQAYYYAKLDVDTEVVDANAKSKIEDSVVEAGPSKKKAILLVILLVLIHFILMAFRYVFDNSIKHTDSVFKLTGIPEYTRMIDWDCHDSKKGLDRYFNNIRFSRYRRTSISDTMDINAMATVEKLKNREYDSVAILGIGLNNEREEFASRVLKVDRGIKVKSIDSITHSINGADEISGVKAAIIAVKVGFTIYTDLYEELQSLRDRDVDVIGIAVFE